MKNMRFVTTLLAPMVILIACSSGSIEMESRMEIVENLYLKEEVVGQPALEIEGPVDEETLQIIDVVSGSGSREVALEDTLVVNYLGVGSITGFSFDSSYSRNEPAVFPLAAVIKGWQQGLIGMKEGGRRVLIIPSELGYGPTPPPGSGIEPNEALIFLVDLIQIN